MAAVGKQEHVREEDLEFFERELASFVPDRVFDAHAHLWHRDQYPEELPPGFPPTTTHDDYLGLVECLFPGRQVGGWFLPKPSLRNGDSDRLGASEWVATNVAGKRFARGAFLVLPDDDPEWIREQVKRLGLCGFKCYHVFAKSKPTWEAAIPDYLPEQLVRVAGEEGWVITLHMVTSQAVADPGNIHWIRRYCENYPDMKLILAHSARGFQPAHNFEGLPQLGGLGNLYFDASANCEPLAHESIIRIMGHERLMNGTDFGAASHGRGRSVAAADSFLWLYEHTPVWEQPNGSIKPVLIALEYLRSLKWACWSAKLTDSQVEDIFWNNAAGVFGIK